MNFDTELTVSEKIDYINTAYFTNKKSIPQIAKELGTYTNKICRFCKKHGIELKGKSKALKEAYEKGLKVSPMKGKTHDEVARLKISEKNAAAWANLSDEQREHRSQVSKEYWHGRSKQEKKDFQKKSNQAIRKASNRGSKLERHLLQILIAAGYKVDFHVERKLVNTRLQVDMLLPEEQIVIEVDGLSHLEPIWGEESFKRTKKSDAQKEGLLIGNGYVVIRIQQTKDLSQKIMRDAATKLLTKLRELTVNGKPKREERKIVIEI